MGNSRADVFVYMVVVKRKISIVEFNKFENGAFLSPESSCKVRKFCLAIEHCISAALAQQF